MSTHHSRVSVGIPVFNGENYLEEALQSILAQSYQDFELIISDNASTDRTEEICKSYAAQDERIRYYRSAENLGAAKNFNHVFELSRGEYFKWAAHDDLIAPDFLLKCVDVLDKDIGIVLCYSKATIIDEYGRCLETYERKIRTDSSKPRKRFFSNLLCRGWFHIFGLIRASALQMTPLMGNHAAGDSLLLTRLNFLGPFHEIPEYLLSLRKHPQQSMYLFGVYKSLIPDWRAYTFWFDPARRRSSFPTGPSLANIGAP